MANSNGWGDGAGNNAIGWGQGANNNIGWGDSHAKSWAGLTDIVGITTDPDASAFIAAAGITGATQQLAIDNLVKGLKADGIYSKMKAVYPFVTDNRNLLGYTEDFSNVYWTKDNCSLIANNITAPNGTNTADRVTINSINAEHLVWNPTVLSSTAGQYTSSIYLKKGNSDYIQVANNGAISANYAYIVININNGDVTQSGASGSYTLNSYQVTSVGDGWYRCSITYTTSSDEARGLRVRFSNSATPVISGYGTITFIGNGTDFFYLWGAQFELSTLTTYQPILTTQQAFIASQFKYNLVNPVDSDAAFRLVFNGGWTHSSTGATPNGTNGYADTKLNDTSLTPNSSHMSYYSRTNALSSTYEIGIYNGTKGIWLGLRQSSGSVFTGGIFQAGTSLEASVANLNSTGYYIGGKNGNTTTKFYKNGANVLSIAKADTTATNTTIYLASLNQNGTPSFGFSTKQVAFSSIGDGLTDTEAANLYTRVQTFNQALSRNV
jgi:hypothetical protein